MRILFLCGCLEPGKNGVGDYTLRLADALRGYGIDVKCIAIHDCYVREHSDYAYSLNISSSSSLRLSSFDSWNSRFKTLSDIIDIYKPDWISLQYVPYSFSDLGLPFKFTLNLVSLSKKAKWHIMFHELWIGRDIALKKLLISKTQEKLIQLTTLILKPTLIHTSINHYQQCLQRLGISSNLLPLFSNIPISTTKSEVIQEDENEWTFVFFGSLDTKFPVKYFLDLIDKSRKLNMIQKCRFIRVGKIDKNSYATWELINKVCYATPYPFFHLLDLGEKSPSFISSLFMEASFGISMAPFKWIGKSGSVAAMIEHGLPVLVPVYDPSHALPTDIKYQQIQLISIDDDLPCNIAQAKKSLPFNQCLISARLLLEDLQLC